MLQSASLRFWEDNIPTLWRDWHRDVDVCRKIEMDAAIFIGILKRRAQTISSHPDPLVGAFRFLKEYGETGEGRILRCVIDTLATGKGEYVESDLSLISDRMLAVLVALIEAREHNFYTEDEWRRIFADDRVGPMDDLFGLFRQ